MFSSIGESFSPFLSIYLWATFLFRISDWKDEHDYIVGMFDRGRWRRLSVALQRNRRKLYCIARKRMHDEASADDAVPYLFPGRQRAEKGFYK